MTFVAARFYLPVMCIAGVAIGACVRAYPELAQAAIPPYVWLLAVSLVFDIFVAVLGPIAAVTPLSMNARVAGFLSGAILYMLIIYVFARPQTVAQLGTGLAA